MAEFVLVGKYYKGEGVPRDYTEATKWYRRAADQGHVRAPYALGLMYANGVGVPRDNVEAAKWYLMAAERGDPYAQFSLSLIYVNGQGVPRDYVTAYMPASIAAAATEGHEKARKLLDLRETTLTNEQRAEAQRMAREWSAAPRPASSTKRQ